MDISFEQREAIRCLYAYGCEGAIGPGGMVASSGGGGSGVGLPILGKPETWLRLVSLGLATGNGPHRIRLTALGEEEANKPVPDTHRRTTGTSLKDMPVRLVVHEEVDTVEWRPKRAVPLQDDIDAVMLAIREAEATTDLDDGVGQGHLRSLRDCLDGLLAEQRRGA
ncbi:hypothetical protein [Methylobacterium sp. Leaf94]|uniref:hypothetical protein n=1 Tax=Methylobacterium sp. Leaf94 TaxID=1736250 RepID=UPI000A9788CC|nr:hypothetical protein [Methylobacterium sp. Leaf94]